MSMTKIWMDKAETLETMAATEFDANGCFTAVLVEKAAACKAAASRVREYEIEVRRLKSPGHH